MKSTATHHIRSPIPQVVRIKFHLVITAVSSLSCKNVVNSYFRPLPLNAEAPPLLSIGNPGPPNSPLAL